MGNVGQAGALWPDTAAVIGASGGIGSALCEELAARGASLVYAGSRTASGPQGASIRRFTIDLTDEAAIITAAEMMRPNPPRLVIVATGALTLPDGTGPERSYKAIQADAMAQAFAINTIGPALVAKHVLPLFDRTERCVFAVLSARVGSIGDNRIGGWHSYRASKAALNMLVKNLAIELGRTHRQAVAVSLHPGTVDTALSAPFQANLKANQLTGPEQAARNLLDVIERLGPDDSGHCFDWRGEPIAP